MIEIEKIKCGDYVLLKSCVEKSIAGQIVYVKYAGGYNFLVSLDGKDYTIAMDDIERKCEKVEYRSILDEAKHILGGNRQSDYGDAVTNFDNISKMASMITGKELSPSDCVSVQIAVKLCRQGHFKKRDNMVDLAGYAEIMQQINERK